MKKYTKPNLSDRKVEPETVTAQQAKFDRNASPYENGRVDKEVKKLIKAVLKTDEFRSQAKEIYDDSVDAKRELGALGVYENDEGNFDIYSIEVPNPNKANSMSLDLPEGAGELVFTWHPRPWGNTKPSPPDLRTSTILGAPGVLRYGKSRRQHTIYVGRKKREN